MLFRAAARPTRPRRFDTIPKDRLLALVKEHISDSRMLKLIKLFLDQSIMEVLCRSQTEAEEALAMITAWVEEAGLTLYPTKTKIVDSRVKSFAFLGYSFRGDRIYPRRESLAKLKARIRELTPRGRPGSIATIAKELNRILIGWFYYFRHYRWTIFKDLDGNIRARLRRLQLKRHRTNPKRLPRNQRRPNAFFTKAGLYSLREAHFRFAQSVNY